ncbi:baseplate J/gp47 family protein [Microvirga splendida]|uniref:Baseplate J/gp47 family protein n=1 Tax=Microvirga splendida TaxID=2795727 RepID=A0ABS0Y4F2_9HYPH|nr:baseplate J/gp47 family protein [Microvirga splendida]MBJ6127196.1 baseplate J/gp47 family protein [Microvirga splendida]
MNSDTPSFDRRGRRNLRTELLERARAWFPNWRPDPDGHDTLMAILDITASLSAEVTQRLNRVPEKSFRGMLHWLGQRGRPGTSARLPVVFSMSERAAPVISTSPILLQADAAGIPVVLETDAPVRIFASRLQAVLAAEPEHDRFYGPFPGLAMLEKPEPGPREWRLLAAVAQGERYVQLDPPEGLVGGMVLMDPQHNKYNVAEANGGLVKLSSELKVALAAGQIFERVTGFSPFDGKQENRQEHKFYIGADALLDVETAAKIKLTGDLPAEAIWFYAAKTAEGQEPNWKRFPLQASSSEGIVLGKGEGEIEKREINGVKMRWLLAVPPEGKPPESQKAAGLKLSINCTEDGPAVAINDGLKAVANTAPITLPRAFYPLGREPRLFDAFYLNWPEAFSKPNAYVQLNFAIGNGFGGPLTALVDGEGDTAIVGSITYDGRLSFMWAANLSGAIQIPFYGLHQPPKLGAAISKLRTDQRVGLGVESDGLLYLSATDGTGVWVWPVELVGAKPAVHETRSLGTPVPGPVISETLIVTGAEEDLILYALCGGRIFFRRIGRKEGAWSPHSMPDGRNVVRLTAFQRAGAELGQWRENDGLVALCEDGSVVWQASPTEDWKTIEGLEISSESPPYLSALLDEQEDRLVCYPIQEKAGEVIEYRLVAVRIGDEPVKSEALPKPVIGQSFAFGQGNAGALEILFAIGTGGGKPQRGTWEPFSGGSLHLRDPEPDISIEQAPLRLRDWLLLPGLSGTVTFTRLPTVLAKVTIWNVANFALAQGALPEGKDIVLRYDETLYLGVSARLPGKGYEFALKSGFTLPKDVKTLDILVFTDPPTGKYKGKGERLNRKEFELDAEDTSTRAGSILRLGQGIAVRYATVAGVEGGIATLDIEVNQATVRYSTAWVDRAEFLLRPTVMVSDSGVFETTPYQQFIVQFTVGGQPVRQTLIMPQSKESGGWRLILNEVWDQPPLGESEASVISLQGPFSTFIPTQAMRNPELSWEYWNGRGWWQIPGVEDGTAYLVREGHVKFCIPEDMAPTDVVGQNGHWIRARLVGGDYGQAIIETRPAPAAEQPPALRPLLGAFAPAGEPTILRDTSAIQAPFVSELTVGYQLCCPKAPDVVMTLDNGAFVDQTAANLTPNARLAVFTPIKDALRRDRQASPETALQDCGCGCKDEAAIAESKRKPGDEAGGMDALAIYLGFDQPLHGALSLLFIVDETEKAGQQPMRVEALVGQVFKTLPIKDETQSLSETGIVSFVCEEETPQAGLFGKALHWLRLRPPVDAQAGKWQPVIRGVYLNGAWAYDRVTRSNEIVGFSDGSQGQVHRLAHGPVLKDTLMLFVREPIGDDDRNDLRDQGVEVEDSIGGVKGAWVRWNSGDLAVAGNSSRIFDFDRTTGTLTFGDGRQGAIPPIGTDNIVAASYLSGGGEAANAIGEWSPLNLISPLRGVEAVVTPQAAAGGSDAQDQATTLRFASANIALRERAVTLGDFVQHARQFSADIAQAKAMQTSKGIEVAVAMRGTEPLPSHAVRRELENRLRSISSPTFAGAQAIAVVKPQPVLLDVSIAVTVEELGQASAAIDAVKDAVRKLLDPATGGVDGLGWPLGVMPREDDVAAVVVRIARVLEIDCISVRRQEGATPRWLDLATVMPQSISVHCAAAEPGAE